MMNRRDFLKLGSLFSAVGCVSATPLGQWADLPVEAVANGKLYRGTEGGSIHVSTDRGQTWQMHANFGPDNAILGIFTGSDGRLYAQVGFKQYAFDLVLAKNEKAWLSQPH